MDPWSAVGPAQQTVRLVIAHDPATFRVPDKRPSELACDVGQDARGSGNVTLLNIGHGLTAGLNRL